jgi:hypothetical protein
MIEVFKTNIAKKQEAGIIENELLKILPGAGINFDLEDCDRVLRVESAHQNFDARHVIALVAKMGFECQVLTD